jgi:uncharacterized protein
MNVREFDGFIFAANRDGQWAALPHDSNAQTLQDTLAMQSSRDLLASNLVVPDQAHHENYEAASARWHGQQSSDPRLFIVHLTQRCNLTCGFCHSSAVGVAAKGMDATPETLAAVAKFIANAPGQSKTIAFQGGEPSLCLDLIAFFQAALTRAVAPGTEISYGMTTNGTLLSPEVLEQLEQMNVKLSLSVDGPAALHDIERRFEDGSGSYTTTTAARSILQDKYKHLYSGQIMVVTAQTAEHYREIIDELIAAGGRSFRFKMVTPLGRGKRYVRAEGTLPHDEVSMTHIEVIKYLKQLFTERGLLVGETYVTTFLRKLMERINAGDVDTRNPCGIASSVVDFDVKGRIHACHETSKYKPFLLGDASMTYDAVYDAKAARTARSYTDIGRHEGCRTCAYFSYCTPCPAKNYQSSGDPEVKPMESPECLRTISVLDFILQDMQRDPHYYHAIWQQDALARGLTALTRRPQPTSSHKEHEYGNS